MYLSNIPDFLESTVAKGYELITFDLDSDPPQIGKYVAIDEYDDPILHTVYQIIYYENGYVHRYDGPALQFFTKIISLTEVVMKLHLSRWYVYSKKN